jgi:parallel beta-helix repeat protein
MRKQSISITVLPLLLTLLTAEQTFAAKPDIEALRELVRQRGYTFEVGPNPATEYSLEQLCGTKVPDVRRPRLKTAPLQEDIQVVDIFDWRKIEGCTPVKSQGLCGSCWAFAAIGITESTYLIKTGLTRDFSEQWLISCTTAGSCNGGWYGTALEYLITLEDQYGKIGVPTEEDYPYEAMNSDCINTSSERFLLTNWSAVDQNIDTMKWAIQTYGPIAVTVYAGDLFQCYIGGIFNADEQGSSNHAVVLVGWDDTQGTEGVWLLRNSWGPGWGEYGYMRIEYGKNNVGGSPCYAELTTDNDPNIYDVPDMFPTIREAVEAAYNGDIITLAPGTYTGPDNTDIDFVGKNLTIRSVNPSDFSAVEQTVIDCQGYAEQPRRAFIFNSGEGPSSVLDGLTIRNGYVNDNGGAIYCYYSSPTFKNCIFENNTATGYKKAGGAIALYNSSPEISNCLILDNSASGYGGGISCRDSSQPKISNSQIIGNQASIEGGGVYCWVNSVVVITNTVIAGNHADDAGGGIFFYECTGFDPNFITETSYTTSRNADQIPNSYLLTESSDDAPNNSTLTFCTITENSTGSLGGGIFCYDSIVGMNNSILWNNTSGETLGSQIAMIDDSLKGTKLTVSYCDVTGLDQGHLVETNCTLDWGYGNFNTDPLFANPALQDYHLKSASGHYNDTTRTWVLDDGDNYDDTDDENSPCIDAGDPAASFERELKCNGWRVNIGAFGSTSQASRSPNEKCCMQCMTPDFNCDCIVNLEDFVVLAQDWLRCNLLPRHHCDNL